LIDLHSHTDASDGTDTPRQLIDLARSAGLSALSITDHDTFFGYEQAKGYAASVGCDLICGIELSTKFHGKTVHLLAYFPHAAPTAAFGGWVREQQEYRRDRNIRLVAKLNEVGVAITLAEVEAIGRTMTGRPHFARVLLEKGYVKTTQEAFDTYLAEEGRAFVQREEVALEEALRRVEEGGGISVMAHPIRLGKRKAEEEEALVAEAVGLGMMGIEVIHSDHSPADVERYRGYAAKYGLLETGGSDHHGGNKPDIALGSGRRGNVAVPDDFLVRLRSY
jgi:3',5'-nucleoside bisphosphate phosphatase